MRTSFPLLFCLRKYRFVVLLLSLILTHLLSCVNSFYRIILYRDLKNETIIRNSLMLSRRARCIACNWLTLSLCTMNECYKFHYMFFLNKPTPEVHV